MNYVAKKQQATGVTGWDKDIIRYYPYADALTCAQADAQFDALTPEQQLAQTSLTEPVADSGYKKQVRSCSAGADTPWQVDTDDGTDGYSDSTGSNGTNTSNNGGATVNDPGAETNVTNYTSASGDDGGLKSAQ